MHPVGKPAYRDFTLVMADDDPQIGASFMPYPFVVDKAASVRVNYQQAPRDDSLSNAFSSAAFGDPATPILTAYAGDPMVVHTLVAPGSEQMHALNLGGLSFPVDPNIAGANTVQTGGVGPWEMLTSVITGGAGGTSTPPATTSTATCAGSSPRPACGACNGFCPHRAHARHQGRESSACNHSRRRPVPR